MREADATFLFRMLVEYAKKMNDKRCYDVVQILDGYDREVLSKFRDMSPLARKWSSMIKEYQSVDPRKQSKLPGFY